MPPTCRADEVLIRIKAEPTTRDTPAVMLSVRRLARAEPATARGRCEALAVIERVEALTPGGGGDRPCLAERIEAFRDRRVLRHWTLVGVVNGWPQ
jgi:hypothetical protein